MTPVLAGDLSDTARALLVEAPGRRVALCRRIMAEARAAQRHLVKTGRLHPTWGNGTLMAAARRRSLPPEPNLQNADYCRCLCIVLTALIEETVPD